MRRFAHTPRCCRGPQNEAFHHVEDDEVCGSGSDTACRAGNARFRSRRWRGRWRWGCGRRHWRCSRQRRNKLHRDGRRPLALYRQVCEHEQQHQSRRRCWQHVTALCAESDHQQQYPALWHEEQQFAVVQPRQQQRAQRFRRRRSCNWHAEQFSASLSRRQSRLSGAAATAGVTTNECEEQQQHCHQRL